MATPSARMTINLPEHLHKRLKYQAFMRDTTMTRIMERATAGLVDYLEADNSEISRHSPDGRPNVTISTSVTADQADLFHRLLDQRRETAHDVLERAIAAYLANVPSTR